MKATKIIMMAALALMTAACSNDDNDIQTPAEQPAKAEGIPFTATISMGESASTRALTEDTENKKIVATWATGEKVALIYDAGGTPTKTDAEVTKQADGTATISATLASGATNGSDVTIIYPSTAADGTTGNVLANLLAAQDGTLATIATNYEVRKGTGKLSINAGGATVNNGTAGTPVSLAAQNAIFKFTIQDLSSTDKTATQFKVSDNSGNVITTVTPTSSAFYVALPALATGTYWFDATIDSKPYIANASLSTATVAGKYYQSTVKMATVGDAILSNGKFATKGTSGQEAVIVYVGTVDKYFNHFLAIALVDAANKVNWSDAQTAIGTYAGNHPITIGGTTYDNTNAWTSGYDVVSDNNATTSATATTLHQGWRMPTVTDWRYLYAGIFGKSPTTPIGINGNMHYYNTSSSGDDRSNIQDLVSYNILKGYIGTGAPIYNTWFSSEVTGSTGYAWNYQPDYCYFNYEEKTANNSVVAVFAY